MRRYRLKKLPLLTGIAGLFIFTNVYAGVMGPLPFPNDDWRYVATISAGPIWQNSGETHTFFITNTIAKSYRDDTRQRALGGAELFLGLQQHAFNCFEGQAGLALGVTGNAKMQGAIWDNDNPLLHNYDYTYQIRHSRIAAKAKLLAITRSNLSPYVSGSAGAAFNNAHDFRSHPTPTATLPNPNFSSYTQTSFTFTLGGGVDWLFSHNWHAGVGFDYMDWGQSQLGQAPGQTVGEGGITTKHIYTRAVMVNLSYVS